MSKLDHFHLSRFEPTGAWPEGGWSLYRITGENIASRTVWERTPDGLKVTERWPWPGFIGLFSTLAQVMREIETGEVESR